LHNFFQVYILVQKHFVLESLALFLLLYKIFWIDIFNLVSYKSVLFLGRYTQALSRPPWDRSRNYKIPFTYYRI